MTGHLLEDGDFALARCRECEREVLTYPDLEAQARRCLHCDERIAGPLRAVTLEELPALGYEVRAAEEEGGGCVACVRGGCAVDGK